MRTDSLATVPGTVPGTESITRKQSEYDLSYSLQASIARENEKASGPKCSGGNVYSGWNGRVADVWRAFRWGRLSSEIWRNAKSQAPEGSSTGDRKYKSWCRKPLLCLGKVASGAGTESTRKQEGHSYWLGNRGSCGGPRYTATAEWWGESLTQSSKVNGRGGKGRQKGSVLLEKFSCKWKQRNEREQNEIRRGSIIFFSS